MYYVQYAHARICSLLSRLAEEGEKVPAAEAVDAGVMTTPEELALIKPWPSIRRRSIWPPGTTIQPESTVILVAWQGTSTGSTRLPNKGEEPTVLSARLKLADTVRAVPGQRHGAAGRIGSGKV